MSIVKTNFQFLKKNVKQHFHTCASEKPGCQFAGYKALLQAIVTSNDTNNIDNNVTNFISVGPTKFLCISKFVF